MADPRVPIKLWREFMEEFEAEKAAQRDKRAALRRAAKEKDRVNKRKRQKVAKPWSRTDVLYAESLKEERARGVSSVVSSARAADLFQRAKLTAEDEEICRLGRVRRQRQQFVPMSLYPGSR